ncbi:MAG: mandelate racemase, partial [Pseudomonadota bacterium]
MSDQQATAAIYPIQARRTDANCAIVSIATRIVDCPTTRRHRLSNTEVSVQSYVIVEATLADGSTGFGEASTLGGPRWAEESVEAIKANIDHYLAPAVIGKSALDFERNALRMSAAASRNNAAKAAVESALFDAAGHALDFPAATFLGGVVRDRIEVIWALASGDAEQEIEEAKAKLAAREHQRFKIKLGFQSPADDMIRLRRIVETLSPTAEIIV